MAFDLDDYVDVAERMKEFFEKYPEGSFQTVSVEPMVVGGEAFVSYTAACFRSPDDPRPGHGTAWEPVPGKTPYTRDSELMNAETSAWGRAIVAIGASTAKKIASANEVQNRQYTQGSSGTPRKLEGAITEAQEKAIKTISSKRHKDPIDVCSEILQRHVDHLSKLSKQEASEVIEALNK
jgi:hypothetical protein